MIDDPIRQLERELTQAAARLAQPQGQPIKSGRARGWRLLVLPVVVVGIGIVVLLIATAGTAPTPSLAAAAYARVSPGRELVYVEYETGWYSGGHLYERARGQVWYTATQERSIGTSLAPRSGRALQYLEVVRNARQVRSYESGENTLTSQANCRRSGRFPRSLSVDPIANFRSLYQAGRIAQRGTATFDGQRVALLVADQGDQEFTFLVTPKAGEPVAMRVTPKATARSQTTATFTGTVVRFLAHSRQPLTPAARSQLAMRPHRGAKIIHLGRRFCPHR